MHKTQLRTLVVDRILHMIPKGYSIMSSKAIMMIIAHESQKGKYIKQLGAGPALGLIQMEPPTHQCVWDEGDSVWENALICKIITQEEYNKRIHPHASRLLYDLRYNVFMARQRLFMKPEALPDTDAKLSRYLKKHWNTIHGEASAKDYLDAYNDWE